MEKKTKEELVLDKEVIEETEREIDEQVTEDVAGGATTAIDPWDRGI